MFGSLVSYALMIPKCYMSVNPSVEDVAIPSGVVVAVLVAVGCVTRSACEVSTSVVCDVRTNMSAAIASTITTSSILYVGFVYLFSTYTFFEAAPLSSSSHFLLLKRERFLQAICQGLAMLFGDRASVTGSFEPSVF
jgi:hypothetical protein